MHDMPRYCTWGVHVSPVSNWQWPLVTLMSHANWWSTLLGPVGTQFLKRDLSMHGSATHHERSLRKAHSSPSWSLRTSATWVTKKCQRPRRSKSWKRWSMCASNEANRWEYSCLHCGCPPRSPLFRTQLSKCFSWNSWCDDCLVCLSWYKCDLVNMFSKRSPGQEKWGGEIKWG